MLRRALLFAGSLCSLLQAADVVKLWPQGAPGALGSDPSDQPSLQLFPAAGAGPKMAVIVCPGGSYLGLSMKKEGTDVAAWLNTLGISAYVLQYRLGPRYHHPIELGDAQRAIRYVRAQAETWQLDQHQIGIMGFSAGGHLAATAATHYDDGNANAVDSIDRQRCRPDFVVLAYPVITMTEPYVHQRSRTALLGDNPSQELINLVSNELQVAADTPPAFLFHTSDDTVVPVQNSVMFYLALRKAKVPAEMHIYPHGAHGAGLAFSDPVLHSWPELLKAWLLTPASRQ